MRQRESVPIIVQCSNCGYKGDPAVIYKSDPLCPNDVIPEPACPICWTDQWITLEEVSS